MLLFYLTILAFLSVFSYAFRDPNLPIFTGAEVQPYIKILTGLVYQKPFIGAGIFTVLLAGLSLVYLTLMRKPEKILKCFPLKTVLLASVFAALSYPALTHDLFNYLTTAKVLYHYGENPYVVMPVEIPSEPYLAFTRAANKVALYGPVWLALSFIPHLLGFGNILATILSFKLFAGLSYVLTILTIRRLTGKMFPVLLFALNPLVVIEILVSGHNDLWMMLPAIWGLYFLDRKKSGGYLKGLFLLIISGLVKGAGLVLIPLGLTRFSWEKKIRQAFWVMLIVFAVFGPMREELYPWYFTWAIVFAALDGGKNKLILTLTVILSLSLELRHLSYIATGRYDGYGPLWRTFISVVPAGSYVFYYLWKKLQKKTVR